VAVSVRGAGSPDELTGRLDALFRFGTVVAAAEDEAGVLTAIVEQASVTVGASFAIVGLIYEDLIRLAASRGLPPEAVDNLSSFPLAPGRPMTDAITLGEAIFCSNREERDRLWPTFRSKGESVAFAVLPLQGRAGVLGAINLGFAEEHDFDAEERSFLQAFAVHGALAIENARLYRLQLEVLAAERLARERTERLQRFSTRLAPAMTVDAVAEIAVDKALVASRAATAMLALRTADGSQIEVRHIDGRVPEGTLAARRFPLEHRSAIGEVFRTQKALWFSDREAWEQYPEAVARPDFLKAAAVLPVADAQELFGVLEIAFEQEHAFVEDERKFLSAIASQTALALDRARLHEEQHHIAHVLQRSLLPETLPPVPGIKVATTYQAAGANETGGDFYDVFEVDKGHIVVIGDVCGHGAEAAALTALCRYTLRAASLRAADAVPGRLLDKLNQAILRHSPSDEDFASATCLLLQPKGRSTMVTLASAGHPPALVRRHGGAVEQYEQSGPITGLFVDTIYQERSLELGAGDLLLLYTDGLTDAKGSGGERLGYERVVEVLADMPDGAGADEAIAAYDLLLARFEVVDDVAVVAIGAVDE
jgi:serine phosphatase RsbU (regulator of sigma subunit)